MREWLGWLEATDLAAVARESLYGFQILVGIHILSLIFSVGMLLWADFRMLGICWTARKVSEVYSALSRWFVFGFTITIISGIALFAGFATSAYENVWFRIKVLAILFAGVNAAIFHLSLRQMSINNESEKSRAVVPMAGLLSIALWTTVILCGRMMSYTLF